MAVSGLPRARFDLAEIGGSRHRFDQIEHDDDERMSAIVKLAYKRGEYGYALFED